MLKKQVLVNGISNLSDARYCAGMMVDYLSFELNSSHEDFIPFEKIGEIKNWLSGPKIGGRLTEWTSDIPWDELNLDFLIINDAALFSTAKTKVDKVFIELFENGIDYASFSQADHLIVSKELFTQANIEHSSIFIGYSVDESDIENILGNKGIEGVALRGNQEERPGFSQYEQLMDTLEALED